MQVPIIVIDTDSPIPPYEQICVHIRRLIVQKQLTSGMLLPSVRQLARDLGIAASTVARAYTELEQEKWVQSLPRRGVIIATHHPSLDQNIRKQHLAEAVTGLLQTAHKLGFDAQEVMNEIQRQIS
jgi:GntR family transcriptional regulator